MKLLFMIATLPTAGVGIYSLFGDGMPIWILVALMFAWWFVLWFAAGNARRGEKKKDEDSEMVSGGGCHLGLLAHRKGEEGVEDAEAQEEQGRS